MQEKWKHSYRKLCVNIEYVNTSSSFIHTVQNCKQPRCSSVAAKTNGDTSIHWNITQKKKEQTIPWNNMDESQKHYVKWRKPDTKANLPYFPFPSYSEEEKVLGQVIEQGCWGLTKWRHRLCREQKGLYRFIGTFYIFDYVGGSIIVTHKSLYLETRC